MTLKDRLGYPFKDSELLIRALTHKSFHNENPSQSSGHNEVLEFLGDAVLDLVLAEKLMKLFPDLPEGDLSKIRASLVNETQLAEMASEFRLSEEILLGRGEKSTGGKLKPRLIASALEALIGAIYQDGGFQSASDFINHIFEPVLNQIDLNNLYSSDYKTKLQEVLQEKFRQTPFYEVLKEEGPDHDKLFFVQVKMGEKILAQGQGKSKKQAEQDAAQKALESGT